MKNQVLLLGFLVSILLISGCTQPPGPAPINNTKKTIGFIGCSITHNAVDGYAAIGGENFWAIGPSQENFGGGTISRWYDSINNGVVDNGKDYWQLFTKAVEDHPDTKKIWWELCTDPAFAEVEYEKFLFILEEIKKLAPEAEVYVSPMPVFPDTSNPFCTNREARQKSVEHIDRMVAEGLVHRGPILTPLIPVQLATDTCHANKQGQAVWGQDLMDFFDIAEQEYEIEDVTFTLPGPNGYDLTVRSVRPRYSKYPNEKFPAVLKLAGGWIGMTGLLNGNEVKGAAAKGIIFVAADSPIRIDPADAHDPSRGDYKGYKEQADYAYVLKRIFNDSHVNQNAVGIWSHSSGAILTSNILGRDKEFGEKVAFFIDGEGPHCARDLLNDTDLSLERIRGLQNWILARDAKVGPGKQYETEEEFWQERCAQDFFGNYEGIYQRIQAKKDHALGYYYKHAVAYLNIATNGNAKWTRLNTQPKDQIYKSDEEPDGIPMEDVLDIEAISGSDDVHGWRIFYRVLDEINTCSDNCGDGTCPEVVCAAVGCPCPETKENCPEDCGSSINLSLINTIELTPANTKENRPEFVMFDDKYYVFYREAVIGKPLYKQRAKEITPNSWDVGSGIDIYPQDGSKAMLTDFGTLYAGNYVYFAYLLEETIGNLKVTKQYLGKYDKNLQQINSTYVTCRSFGGIKNSSVCPYHIIDNERENTDDPALATDGQYVYIVNEWKVKYGFVENQPQYRVHKFDFDLNRISEINIHTDGFDGGAQTITSVTYSNNEFVMLGEFVPSGYADIYDELGVPYNPDANGNKDLFVARYDNNWNLKDVQKIKETFPRIEYYPTWINYNNGHYFIAYTSSPSSVDRDCEQELLMGFGEEYLGVYDSYFNEIQTILLSDPSKCGSQGSIAFYDDLILVTYNEHSKTDDNDVKNYIKVFRR